MMHRLIPSLPKWSMCYVTRGVSSASKTATEIKSSTQLDQVNSTQDHKSKDESGVENVELKKMPYLVKQAFANLSNTDLGDVPKKSVPTNVMDKLIKHAKTVNELLTIADNHKLSRKSALSILSTFGDWTGTNKAKLSDFENDARFLSMCRMLSNDFKNNAEMGELATVMGVTGDDQAAKLINTATLSQMVRILEKLSLKKKRSTPLLRALAFNISRNEEKLNIKQCADVLFGMANLNFHDEVLLSKVCGDATGLTDDMRSAVVGSIARSVGIIRCRDTVLLDRLADWLETNIAVARPQDSIAILMALATVAYVPPNADSLFQKLLPLIRPLDLTSAGLYLDAVWSLLLLDKASQKQIALVLSNDFIEKLRKEDGSKLSQSTALKLLNINAAAQYLMGNYRGPRLPMEFNGQVQMGRSKDKAALVSCVMDSLFNLLPGDNFLRRDVDSEAGFLIDGECLIDNKCTPLAVTKPVPEGAPVIRVAILVLGYHDTCVGARFCPNGHLAYSKRLLEARGYKVIYVLHSEFSPSSKLVHRVQYLEQKLKSLVAR